MSGRVEAGKTISPWIFGLKKPDYFIGQQATRIFDMADGEIDKIKKSGGEKATVPLKVYYIWTHFYDQELGIYRVANVFDPAEIDRFTEDKNKVSEMVAKHQPKLLDYLVERAPVVHRVPMFGDQLRPATRTEAELRTDAGTARMLRWRNTHRGENQKR